MSKRAWIIFIAVVVVILGGLIIYSRFSKPGIDVSGVDTNAILAANDQNGQIADHTIGNTESSVILIEYGDFQCPGCRAAHPQVKEVVEEYKDRIAFVFRNFPLTSIHPNALAAAAAAEAAGLQNKYWEMHDALFTNQTAWQNLSSTARTDTFVNYVTTLGLDAAQFRADLEEPSVKQKITFDQALAGKLGVNSTPTFYLNGTKVSSEDATSIAQGNGDTLRDLLDEALGE